MQVRHDLGQLETVCVCCITSRMQCHQPGMEAKCKQYTWSLCAASLSMRDKCKKDAVVLQCELSIIAASQDKMGNSEK